MNRIHIEREVEFPAPEFADLTIEITADYIPEDEEWLLKPPHNYLDIIRMMFHIKEQEYIRYIDNKLLDMAMDCEPQKWDLEEKAAHMEAEGEAAFQNERDLA
jgi:hypothetical protein